MSKIIKTHFKYFFRTFKSVQIAAALLSPLQKVQTSLSDSSSLTAKLLHVPDDGEGAADTGGVVTGGQQSPDRKAIAP